MKNDLKLCSVLSNLWFKSLDKLAGISGLVLGTAAYFAT